MISEQKQQQNEPRDPACPPTPPHSPPSPNDPHPTTQREPSLPQSFFAGGDLPFAEIFNDQIIQQILDEEGVDFGQHPDAIWTAKLTLWTFLHQVISPDPSCNAAVMRAIVVLIALGRPACSANNGAYCKARAKLPFGVFLKLAKHVADSLEQQAPQEWLWKGRHHVVMPDGSTLLLPDTDENQEAFPQNSAQQPGLGFPIVRMVGLFSFSTGCLLDACYGPYKGKQTGETALLRQLLDHVPPGTVLVADRYYCSYFIIALARQRGLHVVFRQHQCRKTDFSSGRILRGGVDHVATWRRPARPTWMDEETYAQMPETLEIRELYVQLHTPGFRVRSLILVTDLLDPSEYLYEEIADLYGCRWRAETNFLYVKQHLQMEHLRCKTPEMVKKEFWAHVCGYNLVCKVVAQAAVLKGVPPWRLSFKAAQESVLESRPLTASVEACAARQLAWRLLPAVGQRVAGDRPERYEPRKLKKRPRNYRLLRRPRQVERDALLEAYHEMTP